MPNHTLSCTAKQRIERAPMTSSCHGYEVGVEFNGCIDNGFDDAACSEHHGRQMRGR